ncbi:hypothetical protein BDZ45DRAFT_710207 [Acephala macrosclerotiorum]|nr:hypothetical protein BDZ45DRAFT_710207 [Acephala macrosclerotiorum]
MEFDIPFDNYDDAKVYEISQNRALLQQTRNFVVEFGRSQARIAFDIGAEHVQTLIDNPPPADRPVRWINLWGPHVQADIVELLGKHYDFSPRLLAIMKTKPLGSKPKTKPISKFKTKLHWKHDVEVADALAEASDHSEEKMSHGVPLEMAEPPRIQSSDGISHYALADQMTNYQSIDIGNHSICVGANFMHEIVTQTERSDIDIISEGAQRRLWSWLVLCDDNTVLSLHEHPGHVQDTRDLVSFRANTLSVLSQISKCGHQSTNAISMITIRQSLKEDLHDTNPGVEGTSLLFYYLFDDWQAVYTTVAKYKKRLEQLEHAIIFEMYKKSYQIQDNEIIPRLHVLGRKGRQLQHLYTGYKNLVQRILDSPSAITSSLGDLASVNVHTGVVLAQSARQRFGRLKDRLDLLIIAQMTESLAEKDALSATYFNIIAQKDSESTARLTRAATLLAKLSVLFLPVGLMTSYFSIQISDLQGVYTSKDYWYAFAVIMTFSFLALFFFSRLLMWCTETLDGWIKTCSKFLMKRLKKKKEREE